jgi:predicted nuclease of predicted toxin-antitoxin system
MKLFADLHISPLTVTFLRSLGHDVVRVTDVLPANASDEEIVEQARRDSRIILTQDLDFSR